MAYYLYAVTVLFVGACLVFRRRLDIYPFAFLASLIYFGGPAVLAVDYSDEAYIVFVVVSLAILLGAYTDLPPREQDRDIDGKQMALFVGVLQLLALLSVGATLMLYGYRELFTIKTEQERSAVLQMMWSASATIGFVAACVARLRGSILMFAAHLAIQLLAGDRTHPFLAVGAVLLSGCYWRRSSELRLSGSVLGICVAVLALVSVFGKEIYGTTQYMVATGASVTEAVAVRLERGDALQRSYEATHTQYILDRVLKDHFVLEPEYLLAAPLHLVPGGARLANSDLHHFSEAIKAAFFPGYSLQSGVAGNFWAEGIAAGGWAGLATFVVIYLAGIRIFNWLLRTGSGVANSFVSVLAFTWVFYIHRCALFQIFSHEKKFIVLGLIAIGTATALRQLQKAGTPA